MKMSNVRHLCRGALYQSPGDGIGERNCGSRWKCRGRCCGTIVHNSRTELAYRAFHRRSAVTVVSFLALAIKVHPETQREQSRQHVGVFDGGGEAVEFAGAYVIRNWNRSMISGVQSSLKQRTVVVIGNGMVGQRFCEQLSRVRQAPANGKSSRSAKSRGRPTTESV